MAKYGARGRKRYATHRFGAVVYVAVDVGQYRPVFRKVSKLINDIQSICYLIPSDLLLLTLSFINQSLGKAF